MAQRIPEGFGSLSGQGAPGSIGNGAGNHHRPAPATFFKELFDGEQGRLGVQGIEYRFHQQDVRPALGQAAHGIEIISHQLVEADVAVTRIIDIRRQ